MAKKADFSFIIGAVVILIIVYAIYKHIDSRRSPNVDTIHVINLDQDKARWESVSSQAKALNLEITRFPAVYGKNIPYQQMRNHGVGNAMVRADRHDHKGEHLNNLGIVGCYLSHRELIRKLGNMNVPDSYGHLIIEDDIRFPNDFLQPGGRWDTLRHHIPADWDMIWFEILKPYGDDIAPGVIKLKSDPRIRVNLATLAYVVKHGSIKQKILPWLEYMNDAYDEQLNLKFNEWNCYALVPKIVSADEELAADSMINKINVAPEEKKV